MTVVEINGKHYQYIEPEAGNRPPINSKLGMMLMAFGLFTVGLEGPSASGRRKEPFNGDIVKEFELIQQKKSLLSRSQRDSVVYQFNRMFREIAE